MSGVYDHALIFCPVCNKITKHLTGWESEDPNVIDIQCTACYGERAVSGFTVKEGCYRRLVQSRHQHLYSKNKLRVNKD